MRWHKRCRNVSVLIRGLSTNITASDSTHLNQIASKLHIHKLEDWYKVPKSHIKAVGGSVWLLRQHETVESLVRTYYPNHTWDHESFIHSPAPSTKPGFTPQLFMERIIRTLFPEATIETNLRARHGIVGDAGVSLELDVYLPDYKLGFEYQDPHHFFNSSYGAYTLSEYKRRDKVKQEQAEKLGITLINVPFWWDWNVESLVAKIKTKKLGVLSNVASTALPFSDTPPQEIVDKYNFDIPGLGAPLQALYIPQTSSFDPTDMLIFEKYDGIRAIWNGVERQCYSRWGKPLFLPNYFADSFPPIWLDGEMWFGREKGTRYQALKMSRSAPHLVEWNKCKYMVFDSPQPHIRELPYLSRFSYLRTVLPLFEDADQGHPYIKLAPFIECTDRAMVEETFLKVREKGGEGIILRHPLVAYESGYSRSFLKHKGFYDAEACVIRKLSGNKFLCLVKKPNIDQRIQTYEVEMTLDEKNFDGDKNDISEGSFVSYKFLGESHGDGPPLHPIIYTIRNDIQDWEQVLHNKRRAATQQAQIWKPRQYANWGDAKIRRKFFEDFAQEANFDSLVAENWYTVNSKKLLHKGADAMINQYYGGSYINALLDLFPNIGLHANKFKAAPKNFWEDPENAKNFFDTFAKSRKFDPKNLSKWYELLKNDICQEKGGRGLLRHHQMSLYKALKSAYPFAEFDEIKFVDYVPTSEEAELERVEKHKQFFATFAESKNFDPKNPENWYGVTTTEFLKQQGGNAIYNFHGSFAKAIQCVYPDIGLESHKFKSR
eukprot:Phypoly_transcript_03154.p1 GENE.Phypoly_transcript_03154~~Phypoly_transcript_03154.p1  ORF type:complete len:822 (-),score=127.19 Phypoly_transcript_03154:90-2411(-)